MSALVLVRKLAENAFIMLPNKKESGLEEQWVNREGGSVSWWWIN